MLILTRCLNNIKIYYADLKISKKLMLLYLCIVVLPLIILSAFFTKSVSDTTITSIKSSYSVALDQLANNLSSIMAKHAEINDMAYNDVLANFLTSTFQSDYEAYVTYKKNVEPLFKMSLSREKDTSIKIYCENLKFGFSGVFTKDISNSGFNLNIEKAYSSPSKLNWLGITNGLKGKVLCVYSTIKNYYLYPKKPLGIMFLYFSEDALYSLINKSDTTSNPIYVINEMNMIITSNTRTTVGQTLDTVLGKGVLSSGDKFHHNGKDYLVLIKQYSDKAINIKQWKLIQLVPIQALLNKTIQIWVFNSIIASACIFISFFIVMLFSKSLNKRFDLLIYTMNQVSNGNTTVNLKNDCKDEIGYIYDNFNLMVANLNKLIIDVYQAELKIRDANIKFHEVELEKREAELIALQSQINPHYLFNTLESIRMNALVHGDNETAYIIRLFGESFRTLIYDRDLFISVDEEMQNINNFVLIQKYRHGERIQVTVKIAKSVGKLQIPKLLIQPLVENAIFHGLEMKQGNGKIAIRVSAENSRLNVLVSDNGVGMEKESLDALLSSIQSTEKCSQNFALKNINSRLRVLYGNEYLFIMTSLPNKGTTIRLTIPTGTNIGIPK